MNSKRLRKACATEAKIATLEFPKELCNRRIQDPELLQWWNALGVMLLTSDANMVDDHTRFFPNAHKGIVVICNGSRESLSHPEMMALLSDFKQRVPEWESLCLDNAIVELWYRHTSRNICVCRLLDGEIAWQESFPYSDPDWKTRFLAAVARANLDGPARLGFGTTP